jgi:peptidoglycan biosynthesis protein MviN/MurJ (putative lipid II flippase)
VSRASRMTTGILLPTALFLSILSPDVVSLKARRRSLPGNPTGT